MPDHRPSRFYVASVYFRRAIRWRRNSSPFISGDAFADISDIVINPPRWRGSDPDIESISKAKVIFCRSDELQGFLDTYSDRLTALVIIAGNSDQEFHSVPRNLPKSLKALFIQNSFVSDNEMIFTLPIGIENLRWGVNGAKHLMKPRFRHVQVCRKVMLGPFGNTHPIRTKVSDFASTQSDFWDFYQGRISPFRFSRLMKKYLFVGAVKGNGVDTHRFWESLYRGVMPIVQSDTWLASLKYLELPHVPIKDWNPAELSKIVREVNPLSFNPREIPGLWMDYWIKKINYFIES